MSSTCVWTTFTGTNRSCSIDTMNADATDYASVHIGSWGLLFIITVHYGAGSYMLLDETASDDPTHDLDGLIAQASSSRATGDPSAHAETSASATASAPNGLGRPVPEESPT
jgi:hypothetical protein